MDFTQSAAYIPISAGERGARIFGNQHGNHLLRFGRLELKPLLRLAYASSHAHYLTVGR
jgi:hypothetical protein